nr:probable S-adenosylmethionine-dependent methyltransferase At5g38780 [Quercus suber]
MFHGGLRFSDINTVRWKKEEIQLGRSVLADRSCGLVFVTEMVWIRPKGRVDSELGIEMGYMGREMSIERESNELGKMDRKREKAYVKGKVSNDFNTLFKSLPPNRQYFAAGVPGSFHGCLFPKGSLHLIHSSCALNWLSKIPIEITDESSPAWNKGRIHYTNATKEVVEAYETQFAKDMESFLFSRAQELVVGGLLVLFVPAVPDVMSNSDTFTGTELDILGSCLMDMAKVGLVEEAKVDSFNVPAYYTPPKKLKALIERNGNFSIKRMELLNNQKKHLILQSASLRSLYLRAVLEGIIEKHFGNDILDELFNRFTHKVEGSSFFLNPEIDKLIILFVLLERNN